MPELETEVTYVTPELAAEWLLLNTGNRRPKEPKIAQYARDMAAGKWMLTGESIKFGSDGRLLDGQNRLRAVIASGATVPIVVMRGIEPQAQKLMDVAPPRTVADGLEIEGGHKYVNVTASIAKLVVHWRRGDITNSSPNLPGVSHAEHFDAINSDPSITRAAAIGSGYTWKKHTGVGIHATATAIGFTWWLTAGVSDAEAATQFFNDLRELKSDGAGDPRSAALQRLGNAKAERERMRAVTQAFILVVAWNAIREGRRVHRIQVFSRNGGTIDFPDPAAVR